MQAKRILSIALVLVMLLGMLPMGAAAAESLTYLDENGAVQTLTSAYTTVTSTATLWSSGWYVASGEVTIGSRIMISGEVKLLLKDGATLNASCGITLPEGSHLTIYAQSVDEATMGALNATGGGDGAWQAGIGAYYKLNGDSYDVGSLTINGGKITATGAGGAGIGGCYNDAGGTVVIHGGIVTARGDDAAGIGGSFYNLVGYGNGGNVTITGGTVTAIGSNSSAGIGGGYSSSGGTVVITGGNVYAQAGNNYAEAIGKGDRGSSSGTLTNGAANGDQALTLYKVDVSLIDGKITDTEGFPDYYSLDHISPINNMLYLYLPAASAADMVTVNGIKLTLSENTYSHICEFDNSCDTVCNNCGAERTIEHTYDNDCDTDCNVCGAERTTEHTYDGNCDTTCNSCGAERTTTASHQYDNACDADCNVCGAERTVEHRYDNDCDTTCNHCGAERTTEHSYPGLCATMCSICGESRETTEAHTYDHDCDPLCSICGERREASHNIADGICTICNEQCYAIRVVGIQVTSGNASDVLGDGKISYDAATNCLTLNGASVDASKWQVPALEIADGTVTLALIGENTLLGSPEILVERDNTTGEYYSPSFGAITIAEGAHLIISGSHNATLTLTGYELDYVSEDHIASAASICGEGSLTVSGSSLTTSSGIRLEGDITLQNSNVGAAFLAAKNVAISGSSVTVASSSGCNYFDSMARGIHGIYAVQSINVTDSKLTIYGGLVGTNGDYIGPNVILGNTITTHGMYALQSITISGSDVESAGGCGGYYVDEMGMLVNGSFTIFRNAGANVAGAALEAPEFSISEDTDFRCGSSTSHRGGTASCSAGAPCSFCGESYGEPDPEAHSYGEDGICVSCGLACGHTYENGICPTCGATLVAKLNDAYYATLEAAIIAANELTNDGTDLVNAQLVLIADATYEYKYETGYLFEGTTFTINEGVTLTMDYFHIRGELVNNGTINAFEDNKQDCVLSFNPNNDSIHNNCRSVISGNGTYNIRIRSNGGVINGGIFNEEVESHEIINGGTFRKTVLINYTSSVINGGTFEDIIFNNGTINYSDAVTINGTVYEDTDSSSAAVTINGEPHTHTPGEPTYRNDSSTIHSILTPCTTCPFSLIMLTQKDHTYTNGYCVCNRPQSYGIHVSSAEITVVNASDVLGDGTVVYDPTTNTLTLNNANIVDSSITIDSSTNGFGIFTENALNLVLNGENYISAKSEEGISVCIYAMAGLSISGSGSLELKCTESSLSYSILTMDLTLAEESTLTTNDIMLAYAHEVSGELNAIIQTQTGPYRYVVYGDTVLTRDLTVDGNNDSSDTYGEITISEGATLRIADGVTLTIADDTNLYQAQNLITNNGTIVLEGSGTIVNNGDGVCSETATHCYIGSDACVVCGESRPLVYDEDLTFNMNISAGADMKVVYTIYERDVQAYTDFYLVVSKTVAGGEVVTTTYGLRENMEDLVTTNTPAGAAYMHRATFAGINAKEMGDVFEATLYAVGADGNLYYSKTNSSSMKTYLIGKIDAENSIPELKTMCVDMLNYGAAAQLHFGYDTENLVNADLTDEQKAYATSELPEAVDSSASDGEGVALRSSVSVKEKVYLNLTATYTPTDPSALKVVICDQDGKVIAELPVSVNDDVLCQASYGEVGAKQMRKLLTATLYEGDKAVSTTITWSVESYVASVRANADASETQIAMVNAMLAYGDAVAAYLTASGQ